MIIKGLLLNKDANFHYKLHRQADMGGSKYFIIKDKEYSNSGLYKFANIVNIDGEVFCDVQTLSNNMEVDIKEKMNTHKIIIKNYKLYLIDIVYERQKKLERISN